MYFIAFAVRRGFSLPPLTPDEPAPFVCKVAPVLSRLLAIDNCDVVGVFATEVRYYFRIITDVVTSMPSSLQPG